jgi:hypothetical protein
MTAPDRTVLENVPEIGYDKRLCPFIGTLESVMAFLGKPCDYDYLMGVTGACFRRIWNRDDGGNVDLMYFSPEPQNRAFRTLGYDFHGVERDEPALVAAIRESIGRGVPVISFGPIGPPEAGIITGYADDGATIFGWSFFQMDRSAGYYELPDWFKGFYDEMPIAAIVIGDERECPERIDVLKESLAWAIELARTSQRASHPDHVFGLAAYDAWADALDVDADYPAGDRKTLETRAMVHCDQVVMLAERRNAAAFLRAMAPVAASADARRDLEAAADLYEKAAQHKVWHWGHWQQPAAIEGMGKPEIRRAFAAHVREARNDEEEAVALLERVLPTL